jgi:hypothetical protein
MPENVPRLMLVLTGIVALLAIFVAIRDYIHKDTQPSANTSTASLVPSNVKLVQKKTSLAKRQAHGSAREANTSSTTYPAVDETDKPISFTAMALSPAMTDSWPITASSTVSASVAHDEADAAMNGNDRVGNEFTTETASAPQCVPLPNVTKPEDVDAGYYQNWAREYLCYESVRTRVDGSN